MANDIKKNPIHYLEHLGYQNRAKKQQQNEYLKKNGHIIKREENFHLFFNGANDQRIKNSRKNPNLEASKSPANRKQWGEEGQKLLYRRRWDKPITPLVLKEQIEPHCPEIINRNSRDAEQRDCIITKSTFKVTANNLVRPDSKKDYNGIAERIEKLNSLKQDQILKILERLESDNYDFYDEYCNN